MAKLTLALYLLYLALAFGLRLGDGGWIVRLSDSPRG
jgi:hypothetical protein